MQRIIALTALFQLISRLPASCNAFWRPRYEPPRPVAHQDYRDYSFGIDFALDSVISSVALRNGSTYGLAQFTGDNGYQSLMREYLEKCYQAHLTQTPPAGSEEAMATFFETSKVESKRRKQFVRYPETSWKDDFMVRVMVYSPEVFEGDGFTGDIEVEILARAVHHLKTATRSEMERRLNITGSFSWAYASVVAPDFLWTTIKPTGDFADETNGTAPWHNSLDEGDHGFWLRHIWRKLSTALYRNEFRRDEAPSWESIIDRSATLLDVRPASFWMSLHAMKDHCNLRMEKTDPDDQPCGPHNLSDTSIVVNFNNASLSLWPDAYRLAEPVWNTFPYLGAHSFTKCKDNVACTLRHWDQVMAKLDTLVRHLGLSHLSAVDLILAGGSWTENTLATFEDRLRVSDIGKKVKIENMIHQPDVTAASQRAARSSMYHLEIWDVCGYGLGHEDMGHNEL